MSDTGATEADAADLEWLSLDADEEVIWVGQPAFETLYGTIATGIVLTLVVIGLLVLLGVPFSYLGIKNTDYVVTTKSLYVKKGILSTNIETVDLDRIQNTEYSQSFWGKRFGYGQIAISTAGSSGAEITFRGIPDAKAVRDRIAELQPTRGGGDGTTAGSGPSGEGEAGAAPASAAQIDELISEVRATREAFERIESHLAGDGEGARETDDENDREGAAGAEDPQSDDVGTADSEFSFESEGTD
jgi:uncharacterized membrane protein YdbT with pleckstrin-like domain